MVLNSAEKTAPGNKNAWRRNNAAFYQSMLHRESSSFARAAPADRGRLNLPTTRKLVPVRLLSLALGRGPALPLVAALDQETALKKEAPRAALFSVPRNSFAVQKNGLPLTLLVK